jgi:hypothetical protein
MVGIGAAIEDILTIAVTCTEEDFENRIEFLPIQFIVAPQCKRFLFL